MVIFILCEGDIKHKFILGKKFNHDKCLVVSFKAVFLANSFTLTFDVV